MAGGWASDGAVQEQIDSSIEDAIARARSQLPRGESLSHCEECDASIPEARRRAIPGVRLCVACQSEHDQQRQASGGYNRRGSKDSQLR
ncbi:DksA/TraR family C4-type zinc finger protein [Pseudomonas lalucatii]|uniref:DksA/TraR family C4-type zinc finger protein n=1 Tax=Pseudomonas lalucatii TaxID=1424203 RepID=A0ABS5Q1M0_9PSED|nr:DksA/TraR family C4-type zinc finger protein [Pseudomonas lalucatii]MBS7662193.1 DksA/TraR family C4-type zinc finger protein [Pseudomonas lalucatii]MBS7690410.1 DksA/TraR family C4-type zinc finger protein [Pseudomonas lalucatii]QVM88376.1 DksA/TraR family C4-type zinc finger protein [Pseudomonas lalucatii]